MPSHQQHSLCSFKIHVKHRTEAFCGCYLVVISLFAVMGRYQRKSTRQSWSEQDMQQAIDAVTEKRMGWLLASKTYNVPFTTLRRRVGGLQGSSKGYLGGHKVTFSKTLEAELVNHIKNLETMFFGLSTLDVRKLAFQIAEAKKNTS